MNCPICGCELVAGHVVRIYRGETCHPNCVESFEADLDAQLADENFDDLGDDVSEYADEPDFDDEPWDGFRDDVEADADVLRMAGWGTDEDYDYYGGDEGW